MAVQKVLSVVRKAVQDYDMICDGDRIAVGVSGGKDSMLMLTALAAMRRFYPARYEVVALCIDLGFFGQRNDYSAIAEYCKKIDVPLAVKNTDIGVIVFDERKEENPCSLCARMRRGALHDFAKELGCNKLALGHHADDAAETFLMNLFIEARLGCYSPVTYLSRKDLTVIRPLSYMAEYEVASAVRRLEVPTVKNPCPADHYGKRKETRQLIRDIEARGYPNIRTKLIGAMQRGDLSGWGPNAPSINNKEE